MSISNPPEHVVKRVLAKVAMGPRGCHISTYSTASHGYAQVGWHEDGKRVMTLCHRVIWIWFRGEIPTGMTVDHMCKNRRCIRLQHLRVISNFENARRTSGRDWKLGECANGHLDKDCWLPAGPGRIKGYCWKCRADADERRRNDPVAQERARAARQRWVDRNPERQRASHQRYRDRIRAEKDETA